MLLITRLFHIQDIRALTLLFTVSSPKELSVGTLLNRSLNTILEWCRSYKDRKSSSAENFQGEASSSSESAKKGIYFFKIRCYTDTQCQADSEYSLLPNIILIFYKYVSK